MDKSIPFTVFDGLSVKVVGTVGKETLNSVGLESQGSFSCAVQNVGARGRKTEKGILEITAHVAELPSKCGIENLIGVMRAAGEITKWAQAPVKVIFEKDPRVMIVCQPQ